MATATFTRMLLRVVCKVYCAGIRRRIMLML